MRGPTWYADQSAKQAHALMSAELERFVAQLFPGYELSHCGFDRNPLTEEVIIKLHLNQLGRVRVVPEPAHKLLRG